MRRPIPMMLALALMMTACGSGPTGESTLDQCSNGRDDDEDGQVDCGDVACRVYTFCGGTPDSGPADAGPVDAAPLPDGAICIRPIDVVLTVDVSSSMEQELAALRDASPAIFDRLRALDPTAQISLVVFVDDALAVNDCAPLLDGADLAAQLERYRLIAAENRSPSSGTVNVDCPENSLDALALAADDEVCPWRAGAGRIVVHVTDDTFAERPTVLSGPFGGGVLVENTYPETVSALAMVDARVLAIARNGVGEDCGAGRSPDVGRGFHAPYLGMASLPDSTRGVVRDIVGLSDSTLDAAVAISELALVACAP